MSFAKNYINYCIRNRLYSKKIIENKLNKFLIPNNVTKEQLTKIYTDEVETKILKSLVKKRTKGQKKINSYNKSKLVNYMFRHGFDLDKIKNVIFLY